MVGTVVGIIPWRNRIQSEMPTATCGRRSSGPGALGALVEVLARFRPDRHILEALKEIEDENGPSIQPPPDEPDVGWLRRRCIGAAQVEGEFVDVGQSTSLARLAGKILRARLVGSRSRPLPFAIAHPRAD